MRTLAEHPNEWSEAGNRFKTIATAIGHKYLNYYYNIYIEIMINHNLVTIIPKCKN